jgi:AcrR family transcriptional regulator
MAGVLAPPDSRPISLEGRIIAATLRCIGQWGLAKTTLDDVARRADCSRATL